MKNKKISSCIGSNNRYGSKWLSCIIGKRSRIIPYRNNPWYTMSTERVNTYTVSGVY